MRDRRHHDECARQRGNLAVFIKSGNYNGGSGYPLLPLLTVVDCGTLTFIEAVFGPITSDETTYAARLLASLRSGKILLADCNSVASPGAFQGDHQHPARRLLVRVKTGRGSLKLTVHPACAMA